ncbi:hypothetical protein BFJ72_g13791 [Fusarium proliferatum]|uniref:Uncharacterized protein n=1 Tax=Gibberella intermedia TaxID=948311 RepID=A0A420SBG8_GIBIN|nr:hypothetical protein BFJ72_g13791 [Fusarium proliferatum]
MSHKPDQNRLDMHIPIEEDAVASPSDIVQALFDQARQRLDAQRAENKPYDPHLRALFESFYKTLNEVNAGNENKSVQEIISEMWKNLPTHEIGNGNPLEDPFFQSADRFAAEAKYYIASSPGQAAEDFANEWMATYDGNKEIAALEQPPEPAPAELKGASGKLQKLLGDHDLDVDSRPDTLTEKEYAEFMRKKIDRERSQAIWEGRTKLPKWMAEFTPTEIANILKLKKIEEKKRRDREAIERKKYAEDVKREEKEKQDKKDRETFEERRKRLEDVRKKNREAKIKKEKPKTKYFLHPL